MFVSMIEAECILLGPLNLLLFFDDRYDKYNPVCVVHEFWCFRLDCLMELIFVLMIYGYVMLFILVMFFEICAFLFFCFEMQSFDSLSRIFLNFHNEL